MSPPKKARKKSAGKSPARKNRKQTVPKTRARKKQARKTTQVKRQLRSLRKGLSRDEKATRKAGRTASRAVTKTRELDRELDKLKKELQKMRKAPKTSKRTLNEYNLFIRRHIKKGKTFSQAVSLWNKLRRIEQQKKPSAYNQFVASMLRQGKSLKEAVRLWNAQKKGKRITARPGIRAKKRIAKRKKKPTSSRQKPRRKKTKKRIVKRKRRVQRKRLKKVVHGKPRRKHILRKRTVRISRPVASVPGISGSQLQEVLKQAVYALSAQSETNTRQLARQLENAVDRIPVSADADSGAVPSNEESAYEIVKMYYREVARLGHKRQLTLDEVIDAYLYALSRIQRKDHEMAEIVEAIHRRSAGGVRQ